MSNKTDATWHGKQSQRGGDNVVQIQISGNRKGGFQHQFSNEDDFLFDFPVETKNRSFFRSKIWSNIKDVGKAFVILYMILVVIGFTGGLLCLLGVLAYQWYIVLMSDTLITLAITLPIVALFIGCLWAVKKGKI